MTEGETEMATVDFRELDLSELHGVRGGLNPQPLPPREALYRSVLSWAALNPQPEPPGIQFARQWYL